MKYLRLGILVNKRSLFSSYFWRFRTVSISSAKGIRVNGVHERERDYFGRQYTRQQFRG
jgi:hypothetical protein